MNRARNGDDPKDAGGSTSRSLLSDARHDDPQAWARLVRLYSPWVAQWCRRCGVQEHDVVDVLQEVFSAVARNLARFRQDRPGDTFRGWLATIARNKVHDYFRRRANEPTACGGTEAARRMGQICDPASEESPFDLGGSENDGLNAASRTWELSGLVARALEAIRGEFQERTWKAFLGVVVDGRPTTEVAEELGMSAGAVRVAKSRVLTRVRAELGDGPTTTKGS